MQYVRGMPAVIEHVPVAEPYGAPEQLVAHAPAVDEPELLVGLRARGRRQPDPTRQLDRPRRVPYGNEAGDEVLSQHLGEALLARRIASRQRRIEQHALGASQAERDIRTGQGEALQQARDVSRLRRRTAHEFAPCGYVEKEIAHFDGCTGRMSGRAHGSYRATVDADLGSVFRIRWV